MEQRKNNISVIGIIFICLGLALLLKQMHIIDISAKKLIWIGVTLFGAASVFRAFVFNVRQKIFFGSLCFFTGILFTLRAYDVLYGSGAMYLSACLLILGLSFLVLFIFDIRDWHVLIPAMLFCGLGAAFMLTGLGYWYTRDVVDVITKYWPLALILFGGAIIFRRRSTT